MPREKAIKTPKELESLFMSYRKWAKSTPFKVHNFVGKDATEVRMEKERPLTWVGFEAWLWREGIVTQLTQYEHNLNESYTEYLPIIRAIKRQCSADVIDGALATVYNQNIAARLEGLKEQSDVNVTDNRKQTADLFPDELGNGETNKS